MSKKVPAILTGVAFVAITAMLINMVNYNYLSISDSIIRAVILAAGLAVFIYIFQNTLNRNFYVSMITVCVVEVIAIAFLMVI